jgi:hypothetical protein
MHMAGVQWHRGTTYKKGQKKQTVKVVIERDRK